LPSMARQRTGASKSKVLNLAEALETIGRPFLRLILVIGYLLLTIIYFTKRVFLKFVQTSPQLKKKTSQRLCLIGKTLTLIGRLVILIFKIIWLLVTFSFRLGQKSIKKAISTYRWDFLSLEIKLPSIKLPSLFFKPIKSKWLLVSLAISLIFLIGSLSYWYLIKDLPNPNQLADRRQIVSTKIYDRNNQLLYKIYRNQNRSLVKLEDVPLHLIQATIAIEDAEFYTHPGLSFRGIFRALLKNLKGDQLYGGSTITQQLVKNTLLTPERTLQRKIKEVLLAIRVEQKFSKDEILQMYFNEVGYGGAVYGVEEAAQAYFGKPVTKLNMAETALLSGLPASPTAFSPFGAHPEMAKERQALVLRRMTEEKFITPEEGEKVRQQELIFAPQRTDIKAPHFVMYIQELLTNQYGRQMVGEGGLEVKTSLDLNLQNQIQAIVSQEIEKLNNLKVTNGAALITNPQTGEILAMIGSKDYFDLQNDGNVNVTLRPRQPGSSIKPVNYSLALENGFTPATIIPDTPITYQIPGQPPYSPRNYDNRFHGNVPLRIALASSYNVPAVKVLSAMGVNRMIDRGQALGITTWENRSRFGLSLTLGGGEVKMIDMAVVYGTLANLGQRVDLNPILEVKNYQGEKLTATNSDRPQPKRVIDSRVAYLLTDIMADNQARTPAFGPNSILVIPNHPQVAVKTGTTQNLRDNWTIGYTPDYLTAVWVGNNDNTPMSQIASGVTGASPIWQKIMIELLKNKPVKEFPKPENLIRVEVCPQTNTLACEGCGGKWEYFLPGTEPKVHCQKIEARQEN